jgi:MFS family permease
MGPFVMGFVIQHLSWQWMFWIMAIVGPKSAIPAIFFITKVENPPDELRPIYWLSVFRPGNALQS